MGLWVLLASLCALFLATLACGWYFRDTGAAAARPLPELPLLLWASTLMLVTLSYFVELAARAAPTAERPVARGQVVRNLRLSLSLSILFLACQVITWGDLIAAETGDGVHPMYAFNFYLMTALHAVHVIGGVVYAVMALRVCEDLPRLAVRSRNLAIYWHFLAAMWLLIVLNLLAIRIPNPEDSFLGPLSLGAAALTVLAFLGFQLRVIALLWMRGERAFALFSLLPPVAFMHAWARMQELGTHRLALRWGIVSGLMLVALMLAGTIHLGQFASNFEEIDYSAG